MDFLPLPAPNWLTLFLILFGGGTLAAGLGFAFKWLFDQASCWFIPVVLLFAGTVVVTGVLGVHVLFSSPHFVRAETVAEQIENTYGKKITPAAIVLELGYPTELPAEKFRVFGKITEDEESAGGFVRSQTYLLWKHEKLVLATSTDGESFSELTPR